MADQNGFSEWGGYMEAKKKKLEEQYTAASAPFLKSTLFAGISIFVNGLTNPSADELKRIMMAHGGTFHFYERSDTTYIIASNLPDVKVRNMDTSKIISAKWVVDCVAANRILDYTQYLLYTNQKTTQPSLKFGVVNKKESEYCNKSKSENVMDDSNVLNGQIIGRFLKEEDEKRDINSNVESKPLKCNTSTARTAVDPNFLPEFYNNSRLHHIATLGAGFKQYVNELREKHDESNGFPARIKLHELLHGEDEDSFNEFVPINSTYIMHIDMDCFFVSVGLRKHPHLRGQPVAVTHSKGGSSASDVPVHPDADREVEKELFAKRFEQHHQNNIRSDKVRNGFDAKMSLSEVASCSYEAREKGVRNGMFVGQAMKLCPELKTIPYDFEGYKEVAYKLYDIIAQYTLQIEAVSCDEMFVDLTDVIRDLRVPPMKFVRFIRAEVREKTGCPCSAGVGANKLQARLATKRAKPDGQFHLEVNDVEAYMADILAEELPGVGSSTNSILKSAGYITCGDLQGVSLAKLQGLVGKKHGETLYQFCRGIDKRPMAFEQTRKSVSAEVNYGIRFQEYAEVEKFLCQLCTEVHSRLCQIKRKTKCITLKIMIRAREAPVEASKFMGHGLCDNITKSINLPEFTNDVDVITRSVLATMKSLNLPPQKLRGIGIQLTKLNESKVIDEHQKENILKKMFNKINEKRKALEETAALEKLKSAHADESVPEDIEIEVHVDVPSCIEIVTTPEKRANVCGILQDVPPKRQKTELINGSPQCVLPAYIDAEFFRELPLEMREGILKEIAHHKDKYPTSSSLPLLSAPFEFVSTSVDYLDEQPSTSRAASERREVKENIREYRNLRRETNCDYSELYNNANVSYENAGKSSLPTISELNVFNQPNCNQLLLEWVKSDAVPSEYDIRLCTYHACEMVRADLLSNLYSPLTYFRKIIESKHSYSINNPWLKAYNVMLDAINHEVNILYPGRKLFQRDTKFS